MKKEIKMPHTYVIIFCVILLCALLTYLVPVGSFETQEIRYMVGESEKTRTVVVPGSFTYTLDEAGHCHYDFGSRDEDFTLSLRYEGAENAYETRN